MPTAGRREPRTTLRQSAAVPSPPRASIARNTKVYEGWGARVRPLAPRRRPLSISYQCCFRTDVGLSLLPLSPPALMPFLDRRGKERAIFVTRCPAPPSLSSKSSRWVREWEGGGGTTPVSSSHRRCFLPGPVVLFTCLSVPVSVPHHNPEHKPGKPLGKTPSLTPCSPRPPPLAPSLAVFAPRLACLSACTASPPTHVKLHFLSSSSLPALLACLLAWMYRIITWKFDRSRRSSPSSLRDCLRVT